MDDDAECRKHFQPELVKLYEIADTLNKEYSDKVVDVPIALKVYVQETLDYFRQESRKLDEDLRLVFMAERSTELFFWMFQMGQRARAQEMSFEQMYVCVCENFKESDELAFQKLFERNGR